MEISRLHEFVVLSRYSRLGAAARELYMSPSTLSQHISALEGELGCTLFAREGGMTLTAAGEAALEHAQRILHEFDALRRSCSGHNGRFVELRMPNYYFGQEPVLVARDEFQRTHPDVRVVITTNEYQMDDPFSVLEEGRSDLAGLYVARGSGDEIAKMVPPGIEYVRIGSFSHVILSTVNHPLAHKELLSLEDLDGQTFITSQCPVSFIDFDGVRRSLQARGVNVRVMYRRSNRHDDIFLQGIDNCLVGWFAGMRNLRLPADVEFVRHSLDFELASDAYVLWCPERMDELQLAYMETLRRTLKGREAAE